MKHILLPLLAPIALPNDVNAESYYLFDFGSHINQNVPMSSLEEYKKNHIKVIDLKNWKPKWVHWLGAICIKGK